jgi:hypothetical protein
MVFAKTYKGVAIGIGQTTRARREPPPRLLFGLGESCYSVVYEMIVRTL